VNAFLSGRNTRTIQAYRQDLEDFRIFTKTENVNDAARLLLSQGQGDANVTTLAYKTSLLERNLSAATVNRRLATLRSMVKLSRTLGLVSWALDIENVKARPYRDTKGPGVEAFRRIFTTLNERIDKKAKRDRAILRLLFDLGLRRGEIVALNISDLDLETSTLSVRSKGQSEKETLSLPAPTKEALRSWLDGRGTEEGPLFPNFDRAKKGRGGMTGTGLYTMVQALGKKLGIKIRPHGIRHTAITEAVKTAQANGMGLEEVLDFSRHKDVKTLMVYRDRERNVQGRLAGILASSLQ